MAGIQLIGKGLLLWLCVNSCTSSHQRLELSEFTINAKNKNSRIIDRFPDYGDGHKDGCLVMQEMHIDLNTRIKGAVSGNVSNAASTSRKPLTGAAIVILTAAGFKLKTFSNSTGSFIVRTSDKIVLIEANCVGYRYFSAKL